MICSTCNRPAECGYFNIVADAQCCDPCHGPHLVSPSNQMTRFVAFHGKAKARKYIASPHTFGGYKVPAKRLREDALKAEALRHGPSTAMTVSAPVAAMR